MKSISAEEFSRRYPSSTSFDTNTVKDAPKYFNFGDFKDVFQRAADDINIAQNSGNIGQTLTTGVLQGGLSPFRAVGAGVMGTKTGQKVSGGIIEGMTAFGEAITPESVQNKVGDLATEVIEGYESMTPEEQLNQRNKLAIAEILSYYSGGTAANQAKNAVTPPIVRGTETVVNTVKDRVKAADQVVSEAANLRTRVQSAIGKSSVDDQFSASAERLIDKPDTTPTPGAERLTGTAARVENIVEKYDRYLEQSTKAIEDIKVDPAISEVGSKMGDAFNTVVRQRRDVGSALGEELKNTGKYKVDIQQAAADLLAELKDSGLSYNPVNRQLTSFQGTKLAAWEIQQLQDFVGRMRLLGTSPSVKSISDFISRARSEFKLAKGPTGVTGMTNAERIMESGFNSLRNATNPEVNGIAQLQKYWELNSTYADLSKFIEEGASYLGKITQSGDFAKDASVAKSAVQSILNNGKKDWMLRLEELSGYNALDESVLALQAMKDAGDFRGLSLLETIKDQGIPTKANLATMVVDKTIQLGKQAVAGSPSAQTRAYLTSLMKGDATKAVKPITRSLKTADKTIKAKTGVPRTKEIQAIEKKIADNVKQQKAAIKAGDFVLVEKLKRAYDTLVQKLRETVRFVRENIGDNKGALNPKYTNKIHPDDRKAMEHFINSQRLDDVAVNKRLDAQADILMERLNISPDKDANKIADIFQQYLDGERKMPDLNKTGRPFKTEGKTKSATTKTTDLLEEARKMKAEGKTFDEFVEAQGMPVYHGSEKSFSSLADIDFDQGFYTLRRTKHEIDANIKLFENPPLPWVTSQDIKKYLSTKDHKRYDKIINTSNKGLSKNDILKLDNEFAKLRDKAAMNKLAAEGSNLQTLEDWMKAPAEAFGENVNEFIVDFKNPMIVDVKGKSWLEISDGEMSDYTMTLISKAKKNGNDGVVIRNITEGFSGKSKLGAEAGLVDDYIALSPDTIKTKAELETLWKEANR